MSDKPNTLNNCLRCQSAQVTALASKVVCHRAAKYIAVHALVHDIYKAIHGVGNAHAAVEADRVAALEKALEICDAVQIAMTPAGREGGA